MNHCFMEKDILGFHQLVGWMRRHGCRRIGASVVYREGGRVVNVALLLAVGAE